jgi:hypothetical protein
MENTTNYFKIGDKTQREVYLDSLKSAEKISFYGVDKTNPPPIIPRTLMEIVNELRAGGIIK